MSRSGPKDRILSSLPLQMFLYFNYYWVYLYFALEILSYIYKGIALPYPSRYVGTDIPLLVLLFFSDFLRIYIGTLGNKTQQKGPVFLFIIMSALVIVLNSYFLLWQTYILRLEQVINVISIIFCAFQILTGFFAIIAFTSIDSI